MRMKIFILCLGLFFSQTVFAQMNCELYREIIRNKSSADEIFNLLGQAFVCAIEKKIVLMGDQDWNNYKISDRKLRLFLLYNRPISKIQDDEQLKYDLTWLRNPLMKDIYQRLKNAMGKAIEDSPAVRRKIDILHHDYSKLEEMIRGASQLIIDRDCRKRIGLLKYENAIYEIILSVDREKKIISIGGKIVIIETGDEIAFSGNFDIPAKNLIEKYKTPSSISLDNSKGVLIDGERKELEVSKILYQAEGSKKLDYINDGDLVEGGGKVWFEITLPEPLGYMLVYLEDSSNVTFNLFPGTRNSIVNGDYLIPANIEYPYTNVQRTVKENMSRCGIKMNSNKLVIGGFKLEAKKEI